MNITRGHLDGIHIIEPAHLEDERGTFIKIFHHQTLEPYIKQFDLRESYYSTSKKNVIRGMHFQIPPEDHAKVVYVTHGVILDVVLDIRKGSPTYGKYLVTELSADNHKAIFISSGFAHGFLSLADGTSVTYMQSTMHSPDHDKGIHIHSFGMDWNVTDPLLSKRDQSFPHLKDFESPFKHIPS